MRGAIQYPGIFGILNWGSVTVDQARQVMVVNSSAVPQIVKLYPRAAGSGGQQEAASAHVPGYLAQSGTPYGVTLNPMLSPLGLPCHAPPWGHISAIDLKTRQMLWQHPLGTSKDIAPMTYTSARTGRQYVVIAAGGHGFLGSTRGDYVMAFALDDKGR